MKTFATRRLRLRLLSIPVLVLALTGMSPAENEKIPELTTSGGKTYLSVLITKVTPSQITIIHEAGVARIPFAELPAELREKLGYDPAKAEAHEAAVAHSKQQSAIAMQNERARVAKKAALLKNASSLFGRVWLVKDNSVVIRAEVPESSRPVVSRLQASGGGGGVAAGAVPSPPKHPRIYGTYLVTNVPGVSTIADDDRVRWVVSPTGTTQEISGNTLRVFRYVEIAE
jgi:hypothetical protein